MCVFSSSPKLSKTKQPSGSPKVPDIKAVAAPGTVPSRPNLLPTDFFVLGNYLGLGNELPYRKKFCPELFGSVTGISSVMNYWTGNL